MTTSILVFGDAMIDRSWVVAAGADTSQSHGGVQPQKVSGPEVPDVRPGGAALTASLIACVPNLSAHLLAAAGPELIAPLKEHNVRLLQALDRAERTTTKFRIYNSHGRGRPAQLIHRFDLDIRPEGTDTAMADNDFAAVIVHDFCKGLITQERLDKVASRYGAVPWLVDSKDPEILKGTWLGHFTTHRPTLLVNRSEFARVIGTDETVFDGPWRHAGQAILGAAETFHLTHPQWDLVLKLDRQGAVACWEVKADHAWVFQHASGEIVEGADGIGAGDAFLVGWASALESTPSTRLNMGIQYAHSWLKLIDTQSRCHNPVPEPKLFKPPSLVTVECNPTPVHETFRALSRDPTLEDVLHKHIALSDAGGHCGAFLTTHADTRNAVRAFANRVRTFFSSAAAHHPLNCIVWAKPGSGKSFLVEELAGAVSAKFIEVNVSSMSSRSELSSALDKAASTDEPRVLVMIDECWATIDGNHVFSTLIDRLWKKTKSKKLVFVLVDSLTNYEKAQPSTSDDEVPTVTDVAGFIKAIADRPKGPDLVSRINGPTMSLGVPGYRDRAILVASLVRRIHPHSAFSIEAGALRVLIEDPNMGTWSPRAIEYAIEALTPSGGIVRRSDLIALGGLCARMNLVIGNVDPFVVEISDSSRG